MATAKSRNKADRAQVVRGRRTAAVVRASRGKPKPTAADDPAVASKVAQAIAARFEQMIAARRSPSESKSAECRRAGELAGMFPRAAAVDAATAAAVACDADQVADSLLRGLSGLGGVLWAAAAHARAAGEPLAVSDIADVGELLGQLARAVTDLRGLESLCRLRAAGTL
jgi:hypothetical protein